MMSELRNALSVVAFRMHWRSLMSTFLFASTSHGIYTFERDDVTWRETNAALIRKDFTCVTARDGVVLAGAKDGIYRSADFGQTWWAADKGLAERHVRSLFYQPDGGQRAYAGTEPAAIFISHDAGDTWHASGGVTNLRDELGWYLPYSPEAGAVRGFAFRGARGYAAVEQGGLLRSDDYGQLWELVEGATGIPDAAIPESFIHPDVHAVAVHPSSPNQVFAATGGGLYHSTDGGARWRLLYACYCRDVWVDPNDPGHLILGPADGVDRNGRIEESIDGGDTWQPIMSGVDDRWPQHMVERFTQAGNTLLAVLSAGELISAALDARQWEQILPAVQDVTGAVVMSE
jgi:photosystem II stability/assembly factor-like uncharacterized protein